MSPPPERPGERPGERSETEDEPVGVFGRFESIVTFFVKEQTMWPILVVVLGHLAAFLASALLLGARDRMPASMVALLGLSLGSLELVRVERTGRGRFGVMTGLVIATWVMGIAMAIAADRMGAF